MFYCSIIIYLVFKTNSVHFGLSHTYRSYQFNCYDLYVCERCTDHWNCIIIDIICILEITVMLKENEKRTRFIMDLSILKLLTLKYYLMCFLPTNKEIVISWIKILPLKNAKEILISVHDKQYKRRKKKTPYIGFLRIARVK